MFENIIESDKASKEAKSDAQTKISNISKQMEKEVTCETLFRAKGFDDALVIWDGKEVNVVVKSAKDLTTQQAAQIQNIISREMSVSVGNIHIMTR
jgi:stage III sporulation protein AH